MTANSEEAPTSDKVGFRDIYRAVGESEARIKEHVTLILLPITNAVADHETRLRVIEESVAPLARDAAAKAVLLASSHADLVTRVDALEDGDNAIVVRGAERQRLGQITNKALAVLVLVTNFILGLIVFFANLLGRSSS